MVNVNMQIETANHTLMGEYTQGAIPEVCIAIVNCAIGIGTLSRAKTRRMLAVWVYVKRLSALFALALYRWLARLATLRWWLVWGVVVSAVSAAFRTVINLLGEGRPALHFLSALSTGNRYHPGAFVFSLIGGVTGAGTILFSGPINAVSYTECLAANGTISMSIHV